MTTDQEAQAAMACDACRGCCSECEAACRSGDPDDHQLTSHDEGRLTDEQLGLIVGLVAIKAQLQQELDAAKADLQHEYEKGREYQHGQESEHHTLREEQTGLLLKKLAMERDALRDKGQALADALAALLTHPYNGTSSQKWRNAKAALTAWNEKDNETNNN